MPKSKRAKLVHLTKTKKKGRSKGDALIEEVRDSVDEFSNIFLFEVENMRNAAFKEIRVQWNNSRFMIGRNKLMMVALGVDEENEYRTGLSYLAKKITGDCGLLFSNRDEKAVTEFFSEYKQAQFARAGSKATRKFVVSAGEVPGHLPVSMEPQLRRLGLPVRIQKGKLEIAADTTVCEEGAKLTAEQCKILEMFDQKMAVFRIKLLGCYSDSSEKFLEYSQ
mmetsp:Transcript_27321/g.43951  ORF Transcript_27321/g.43951 Transcript_27321/m.43951 type:complete len:222 (+) Transcript_27321:19-684(+)